MKRSFDLVVAIILLIPLSIPMLFIALVVKLTSRGPILFWSDRIGINNSIFKMPKFRTMCVDAPAVATHLLDNPKEFLIPCGSFLRRFSLDEFPQLWSVLKGDMSFIGPRPALYNQDDLVEFRAKKGIHKLTPGITGWAQVNGRDNLSIPSKVEYDEYYMNHKSFLLDLKILYMTFLKVIRAEGVKH
jgi:O-antigen biosynthesis protein WbqP